MHDEFDWWSNIWIPGMTGIGALILSAASLAIAVLALRTGQSANSHQARVLEDSRRRERHEVIPLFKRVFRESLNLHTLPDEEFRNASAAESRRAGDLEHRLAQLPDQRGAQLWAWISDQLIAVPKNEQFAIFQALMAGEVMIEEWADDPLTVDRLVVTASTSRGFDQFRR